MSLARIVDQFQQIEHVVVGAILYDDAYVVLLLEMGGHLYDAWMFQFT